MLELVGSFWELRQCGACSDNPFSGILKEPYVSLLVCFVLQSKPLLPVLVACTTFTLFSSRSDFTGLMYSSNIFLTTKKKIVANFFYPIKKNLLQIFFFIREEKKIVAKPIPSLFIPLHFFFSVKENCAFFLNSCGKLFKLFLVLWRFCSALVRSLPSFKGWFSLEFYVSLLCTIYCFCLNL